MNDEKDLEIAIGAMQMAQTRRRLDGRFIAIPTTPTTWIPVSLSAEDFQLILDTMALWKPRIVREPTENTLAPLPPV